MSYSDDSVWFHSHGVDVAPRTWAHTAPELIAVDYSQFPLSERNKTLEIQRFTGWRNVELREYYQTTGMNYRQEWWGQK